MNLTKRAFSVATLAAALSAAVSPLAVSAAENWPPRQITFVVALGPGGSADRTARALAQRLQEELDTPISVINQEGGGGHVGRDELCPQALPAQRHAVQLLGGDLGGGHERRDRVAAAPAELVQEGPHALAPLARALAARGRVAARVRARAEGVPDGGERNRQRRA